MYVRIYLNILGCFRSLDPNGMLNTRHIEDQERHLDIGKHKARTAKPIESKTVELKHDFETCLP